MLPVSRAAVIGCGLLASAALAAPAVAARPAVETRPAAAQPAAAQPTSDYRIRLSVGSDLRNLAGSLDLTWTNTTSSPLGRLQFLLFPNCADGAMRVGRCSVDGATVAPKLTARQAVMDLPLLAPLAPGATVRVSIEYGVVVPDDPQGATGGLSRSDSFASLPYCYPVVLAPSAWSEGPPVPWADFLTKEASSYRVAVDVPAGVEVLSAAEEVGRTSADGRTTVELSLAPARDFYLAVGRGVRYSRERTGGIEVTAASVEATPAALSSLASAARAALEAYSRRFGPYPYRRFLVVTGPLSALGVEFPGATLISRLLLDPNAVVQGVPARALLEATVAHEVAHQWFYNLVGNDQAREPWLDEALSQYATYRCFLDEGNRQAADAFAASWVERWNRVARAAMPIGLPASSYSADQYAAIVYGRGPLFLQALSDLVGPGAFDRLLSRWVEGYRWKIATGRDFQALAELVCGRDLGPLFASWVWPEARGTT